MDKNLSEYFLNDEQIEDINSAKGKINLKLNGGHAELNVDGDGMTLLAAINTLIMFFTRKSEMPVAQLMIIICQMAFQSLGGVCESEEMSNVMHEILRQLNHGDE